MFFFILSKLISSCKPNTTQSLKPKETKLKGKVELITFKALYKRVHIIVVV